MFKIGRNDHDPPFVKTKAPATAIPLQNMTLKISGEKMPFPLSTEQSSWRIQKKRGREWLFVSKNFGFQILMWSPGLFFLKSVGPGFQFYLKKNEICFFCHGVQTVSKNSIELKTISHKIKIKLKENNLIVVRSPSHIEYRKQGKIILFPVFSEEEFFVMEGLPLKIWNALFFPKTIKRLFAVEKTMSKKEIAKAIYLMRMRGLIRPLFLP